MSPCVRLCTRPSRVRSSGERRGERGPKPLDLVHAFLRRRSLDRISPRAGVASTCHRYRLADMASNRDQRRSTRRSAIGPWCKIQDRPTKASSRHLDRNKPGAATPVCVGVQIPRRSCGRRPHNRGRLAWQVECGSSYFLFRLAQCSCWMVRSLNHGELPCPGSSGPEAQGGGSQCMRG